MGVEILLVAVLYMFIINFFAGFFFRKDARSVIQFGVYSVADRWLLFLALLGGSYSGMRTMRRFNYRQHASRFRSNFFMIVIAQVFIGFFFIAYLGIVNGWWDPIIAWGRVQYFELMRSWRT